jgi:hypothetical protein
VARTWLQLRVELLGALGQGLTPAPGRIFIVGPAHSFAALADAINAAFARWDLSHLHEFEVAAVGRGNEFRFVFDLGDQWEHRCRVLAEKVDPREVWRPGPLPKQPVAIWGWGSIPDQYGRESSDDFDLEP